MDFLHSGIRRICHRRSLFRRGLRREDGREDAILTRRPPALPLRVAASRSHRDAATDAWLQTEGIEDTVSAGSSLKFCLLAEGKADLYPRLGPTCEWDTAAAQAVLEGAGGKVETLDGQPLRYSKPDILNPWFVASI